MQKHPKVVGCSWRSDTHLVNSIELPSVKNMDDVPLAAERCELIAETQKGRFITIADVSGTEIA